MLDDQPENEKQHLRSAGEHFWKIVSPTPPPKTFDVTSLRDAFLFFYSFSPMSSAIVGSTASAQV
jgi:hypothetical protein